MRGLIVSVNMMGDGCVQKKWLPQKHMGEWGYQYKCNKSIRGASTYWPVSINFQKSNFGRINLLYFSKLHVKADDIMYYYCCWAHSSLLLLLMDDQPISKPYFKRYSV